MDESKTAKLERAGWKLGTPKESLRRVQRFRLRSETLDEYG